MLKESTAVKKVVIAVGYTDLRLGIDGLAARIRLHYRMNPLEPGTLFLFCGKRRDRFKGLMYEKDSWLLLYKRAVDGVYQWPRDGSDAREITREQLNLLLEGFTITGSIKSK